MTWPLTMSLLKGVHPIYRSAQKCSRLDFQAGGLHHKKGFSGFVVRAFGLLSD